MLYSNKSREDLEKIEELDDLQNQAKALRLQNKLGKQNFQKDMKKSLNKLLIHLKIPLKNF